MVFFLPNLDEDFKYYYDWELIKTLKTPLIQTIFCNYPPLYLLAGMLKSL